MILINLLPHREAARKKRQDLFNISLGASVLLGGVIAGIIYIWLQTAIAAQQELNTILTQEIKKLDDQIKDIAALEAEIAALRARQKAVEDLQADRNMPVYLLNELTRQLPEGVYLVNLKQDNQLATLQGTAQSQERVSELLRNLAYNSPWLTKPELVEIVASNVSLSARDQRRVYNFTVRARLVRASEVQKAAPPAGAASAPVPAGAASAPVAAAATPAR